MNDSSYTIQTLDRAYLESLTTADLKRYADNLGIDIPPDLERIFIIWEILDASSKDIDEEETPTPKINIVKSSVEPVYLPEKYNINFIEVMIRDPLWAFTFWEVKAYDREIYEKSPNFEGYYLKISPLHIEKTEKQEKKEEDFFTISIGTKDSSWYISFPPQEGNFKIELCALLDNEERIITTSRPFTMPELHKPPKKRSTKDDKIYNNPLAVLSGVNDFKIIRNDER